MPRIQFIKLNHTLSPSTSPHARISAPIGNKACALNSWYLTSEEAKPLFSQYCARSVPCFHPIALATPQIPATVYAKQVTKKPVPKFSFPCFQIPPRPMILLAPKAFRKSRLQQPTNSRCTNSPERRFCIPSPCRRKKRNRFCDKEVPSFLRLLL